MRFFIYPKLDGRYYEIVVEHFTPRPGESVEKFLVYGKKKIWIESNRPFFRRKNLKHRKPDYVLKTRDYAAEIYFKEIVKCIDEWVRKNLDTPITPPK